MADVADVADEVNSTTPIDTRRPQLFNPYLGLIGNTHSRAILVTNSVNKIQRNSDIRS